MNKKMNEKEFYRELQRRAGITEQQDFDVQRDILLRMLSDTLRNASHALNAGKVVQAEELLVDAQKTVETLKELPV